MAGGEVGKRQVLWRATPDEVCEMFERSLEQGSPIPAEDLLDYVPDSDRLAMLFGLLQREIFFRRVLGGEPPRDEFERRLPGQKLLIDALLSDDEHQQRLHRALDGDEVIQCVGRAPIGIVYKIRRSPGGQLRAVRALPALNVDRQRLADCRLPDLTFMFHRNLARPFELIEAEGDLLLVTEYVEGPSLLKLVSTHHPMPIGVVCEFVRQACEGLAHVHEHFRTHGDVRPQNLMFDTSEGVVKLAGLGLTELLDLRYLRYATAPAVGEVEARAFLAPELEQEPPRLDPASDVYSLGRTLYYGLTGRAPKTYSRKAGDPTEPLREVRADCPSELAAVIERMVSRSADERYATAGDVCAAIAPLADAAAFAAWCEQNGLRARAGTAGQPWSRGLAADAPRSDKARPEPSVVQAPSSSSSAASSEPDRVALVDRWLKVLRASIAGFDIKSLPARAVGGALLTVVALLALWGGYQWSRGGSRPVPPWAIALAEQPHEYGQWWFDEMPWYAPVVRAELVRRVQRGSSVTPYHDAERIATNLATLPDENTWHELKSLVESLAESQSDPGWSIVHSLLKLDPQRHSVSDLRSHYSSLLGKLPEPAEEDGPQHHFRALLQHKLGDLDAADASYLAARRAYARSGLDQLAALCMTDMGRLYEQRTQYLEALAAYEACLELAKSPALTLTAHEGLARVHRLRGYRAEARSALQASDSILAQDGPLQLQSSHPLRAALRADRGLLNLDEWQLTESVSDFTAAEKILLDGANVDAYATYYRQIRLQQHMALSAYLEGQPQRARTLYRELLDSSAARLKLPLTSPQAFALRRIRAEVLERYADSYLFSALPDYDQAALQYRAALAAANAPDSGFDERLDWPLTANIRYKQVMAWCLGWRQSEAAEALERVETVVQSKSDAGEEQREYFAGARILATAMVKSLASEDQPPPELFSDLRTYVARRTKDYVAGDLYLVDRRHDLDVVLLGSEFLLRSENLAAEHAEAVVRDLAVLFKAIPSAGYLHRYARSAQLALASLPGASEQRLRDLTDVVQRGAQLEDLAINEASIKTDDQGKPQDCRLYALTIGVSKYQESQLSLRNAADDARGLAEDFQALCSGEQALFRPGFIKVLCDEQATRRNILSWIEKFKSGSSADGIEPVRASDLVFVTFSGHGERDDDDRSYMLLPYDYDSEIGLSVTGIHDDQLKNKLASLDATVLLILDSCFSGAAFGDGDLAKRSQLDPLRALTAQQIRNFNNANASGVVLLASSISSQPSLESQRLGHGFLTLALREALQGKYLATPHNVRLPPGNIRGLVTLKDIEYYLGLRVRTLSGDKQRLPDARGVSGDASLADLPIRLATPDP